MLFKKTLLTGLFACLISPMWVLAASKHNEISLSISASEAQKIDPLLQGFIRQVWEDSPALQAAQAAIEAANARADGASKPIYNPDLALDTERTGVSTSSIGISQTLDLSDKRGAQLRIADQEIQAAIAMLQETRQRIAVETLNALTQYFTAREMQTLALRRSELMKGFIDTVKQRQAAGDMGALEGTLAQVTYSDALMRQAASESQLAEAEAALQAVTGLAMSRWPQLPAELASPPSKANVALLESLPALAVLRSRMEAAKSRIRLIEREGRADPTIGIRAGHESSEILLGLSLEIPLFIRNNFKANVRAASQEALGEELSYRDSYRRAKARLNGSLGRFKNTTHAWVAWIANGQEAHHEQMHLLEQMWSAGELTATDYLIQAKQNIETQAAATALMGEVWQAAIVWLDASGQVEGWLGIQTKNTGE